MKKITAKELEERFNNNEDVSKYMDFLKAKNFHSFIKEKNSEYEDINIHFPKKVLEVVDMKIKEIGIDRESFIKMVVAERLNFI